MSGKGLSYGLNITKKPNGSKLQPPKRKPIFDEEDNDDEDTGTSAAAAIEEIGGIDGLTIEAPVPKKNTAEAPSKSSIKLKLDGTGNSKKAAAPPSVYGDLSSSFTSKKHANAAEELDASIYDYDGVYDSLRPQKKVTEADKVRAPKYMGNLLAAAAVRKRDATLAEEKKLAREREAEGDEFADKEKFVTSAYKRQQEENRRLEAEEKLREEREARLNKGTGMTNFYKNMLDRTEEKHAEVVKAAEENQHNDKSRDTGPEETERDKERTDAELAREINARTGGSIAINDEGQVVDKRQLLKGGLNLAPKPPSSSSAKNNSANPATRGNQPGRPLAGVGGSKQAMRERQTRMLEAQLEQSLKRGLEAEAEQTEKMVLASKSRKTDSDILNAKERYLARKREAEAAKTGTAGE